MTPDDLAAIRAVATEHTWAHERLRALADALERAWDERDAGQGHTPGHWRCDPCYIAADRKFQRDRAEQAWDELAIVRSHLAMSDAMKAEDRREKHEAIARATQAELRARVEFEDAERYRTALAIQGSGLADRLNTAEAESVRAQALADYWMDAGADLQENHDRMEFRALKAESALANLERTIYRDLEEARAASIQAQAALAEAELREDQGKVRAQLYGEALARVRALCDEADAVERRSWMRYVPVDKIRAAIAPEASK